MRKIVVFIAVSLLIFSCKTQKKEKITGLITQKAMVVSAREEVSKIAVSILKKGGNAFDAMVATELALAIAYPFAGNLGGGGFMVYRKKDGEIGALDYREKAPLAATKNMYLDENGQVIPNKSILGAMAVGVPGTIAGVFATHKKFGTLPISEILQPVIELAKKGVRVTKKQEKRLKNYQPLFLKANKDSILFSKNWKENDTIKYPSLSETLIRIQKNGKEQHGNGLVR